MKGRTGAFFIVVAIAMFARTADAQDRAPRGGTGAAGIIERIFANDVNDDEKLSARELGVRGTRMLKRTDANSDGFLTRDEIKQMITSRRGARGRGKGRSGAFGEAGSGITRILTSHPIVKALDQDRDGVLSESEINNALNALKSLDRDKDGIVGANEMIFDMSQLGRGGTADEGLEARNRNRSRRPERNDNDGLKLGQIAPDFELKSLDGKTQTKLSELYAKKPVVLFFGSYT